VDTRLVSTESSVGNGGMNDPKDKDPKSSAEDPAPASREKRSGRASFDERGNAVWEWQLETGVYSRDVSTQKLKKLELDDLSIAETAINRATHRAR
jgi:hypothetical protein